MNETPYNLPPGVEPGYILKAGNPLPVGWEGQTSSARGGWLETSCGRHGHCGNVICEVCAEKAAAAAGVSSDR